MTSGVEYCRIPAERQRLWQMIDDACEGEQAVKAPGRGYVRYIAKSDKTKGNIERNEEYKNGASFLNASGRTLDGLVGIAFSKDPAVELPASLEYMERNADGSGVGLNQLVQRTLHDVAGKGRSGLLVSYPVPEKKANQSIKDQEGRGAIILRYNPEQIINWDTAQINGKKQLSLVVIAQSFTYRNEGEFTHRDGKRWIVLDLVGAVYRYRTFEKTDGNVELKSEAFPTDGAGKSWNVIPFVFVGSTNNDSVIDKAPLADLAFLNLSHFRNSADVEESSFQAGQPTYAVSGLTEDWVREFMSDGLTVGARSVIPLPVGGSITMVQADPNNLPFELMKHKEEQMIRLGARLLEPSVNVTATATNSNDKSAYSVLSLCCSNVSEAITQCLEWCCQYMAEAGKASYEISRQFVTAELTSQDMLALVQLWQSGTWAKSDSLAVLRKAGLIAPERTDDDIAGDVEAEAPNIEPDNWDNESDKGKMKDKVV